MNINIIDDKMVLVMLASPPQLYLRFVPPTTVNNALIILDIGVDDTEKKT